jgi:hypothetical protein
MKRAYFQGFEEELELLRTFLQALELNRAARQKSEETLELRLVKPVKQSLALVQLPRLLWQSQTAIAA